MSSVTQPKSNEICPVCDGDLRPIDVPGQNLKTCTKCGELLQFRADGSFAQLKHFLQRNDLGDDQARAAVSTPYVSSVKSFLELFDTGFRGLELGLHEARGGLRTVLAQAENRLDYALGRLTGAALAFPELAEVLEAIRETRELLSPMSGKHRGIAVKETNASATSPSE